MSFARFALRTATVKALRGRTLAGDMVRDSELGPIDEMATGSSRPVVAVYTDETQVQRPGTDLLSHDGRTALVIEIGITTRVSETEWSLPVTDAAMELAIDSIERQARLALTVPDDGNTWAELWRDLVQAFGLEKSQRGGASKDGVRFAGRQIIIEVDLPRDPHPGRPVGPLWQRFLDLVAVDDDMAPLLPHITPLITGGATDWEHWQRDRAAFGLSAARAGALHLLPPGPPAAAPPPEEGQP